jgi:hypothetical protein
VSETMTLRLCRTPGDDKHWTDVLVTSTGIDTRSNPMGAFPQGDIGRHVIAEHYELTGDWDSDLPFLLLLCADDAGRSTLSASDIERVFPDVVGRPWADEVGSYDRRFRAVSIEGDSVVATLTDYGMGMAAAIQTYGTRDSVGGCVETGMAGESADR